MKFVSLFTGVGGLDLGLEQAGMKCIAQVEYDDYCRSILAKHWPRVPKFPDVRTFTRNSIRIKPDLIVGGFPCQDVSLAGKRAGIGGERSGLWKEFLRIIRSFRPSFAIVENVPGLRSQGLDTVLCDLAACGYDAEWDCIPAAVFGAPHLRDRIFIVAYAKRIRRNGASVFQAGHPFESGTWASDKAGQLVEIAGRARRCYPAHLRVDDGLPRHVDFIEASQRIRGCGNAVVPAVGKWVGQQVLRVAQALA